MVSKPADDCALKVGHKNVKEVLATSQFLFGLASIGIDCHK